MKDSCNTLVIQSFGRENEYKRAILTILSYFAHVSLPLNHSKVILFTDNPDYFTPFISEFPVEYVLLDAEKIKVMRGDIDFLHRMKIALIEEAFGLADGNILYADSDTFFVADPTPIVRQLSPDKSFMHLWEYKFEEVRDMPLPSGQTFRDFVALIESKSFFLANGKEVKFTSDHSSWNAGVMMFHPSHVRFIPDVYALTDQFYPPTLNHASEQYAFSLILQENTDLRPCDEVIYHYWYRVKKQIIDQFLERKLTENWTRLPRPQILAQVLEWTKFLPGYFEKHEWMIQDHAIQAFNKNQFKEGYSWAAKAIFRKPFGGSAFIKDTFHHMKRQITKK